MEEKCWVTLTGLTRFARNTTWIGGQTGLLETAVVIRMVARVNRQIRLLRSARVIEAATQSQEILAGLRKIRLRRKAGLWKIRLPWKAGVWRIRLTRRAGLRRIQLTWRAELREISLTRKAGLPNTRVI
jgi:hypothetical protein